MGIMDSRWWIIASFLLFYVLYGVMFLYEFIRQRNFETAYKNIWFEIQARKRTGI